MDQKYILAFVLLAGGMTAGTVLTCVSQRARDVFFLLMVTLAALSESMDVNFISREWYRGTTCGIEVSLVDVFSVSLLLSSILVPRPNERRWFWPPALGWMILFFFYACLCVVVNEPQLFGIFGLSKIIRGGIIFLAVALFIRGEREVRLLVLGLCTIVCFECLYALEQRYHGGIHRVFATLDDSNSLSMYLCLIAPVLLAAFNSDFSRPLKWFCAAGVGLACVAIMLTISRTGVLTIAMVLLGTAAFTVPLKITVKRIAIVAIGMVFAAAIVAKGWNSLSERFKGDNLAKEYGHSREQTRGYYIQLAIAMAEDHWLGVGLNNWSYWVSNKYGPKLGWRFSPYPGTDRPPRFVVPEGSHIDDPQAAPAHSLGALTAGEMGICGLVIFSLVWLRWFQMGASFLLKRTPIPTRRLGIGFFFGTCGIFCQSLTEWVFWQTPIYFTFHIIIGALAALYYLKKQERKAARVEEAFEDEPVLEHAEAAAY